MPEKIEEILKTLHLFLNACDRFAEYDDLLIVSKKEIFQILEKLNLAIYDSMDEMKMTQHQKEQEEKEAHRAADELIEHAAYNAEEVYAASLIYTDDALNKLKEIIEKNNEIIQEEYQGMIKQMEDRMSAIDYNQSELRKQLMDMYQNDFYIKLLNAEKEAYYAKHPVQEAEEEQFQQEMPQIYVNEEHLKAVQEERGVSWFREENKKIRAEEQSRRMTQEREKAKYSGTNTFLSKIREEARRNGQENNSSSIIVNQSHLAQVIKEREAYERRRRQNAAKNSSQRTKDSSHSDGHKGRSFSGDTQRMPEVSGRSARKKAKKNDQPLPRQSAMTNSVPQQPVMKKEETPYAGMEMEDIQESLKETIQSLSNLDFNFDLSKQIEHETEIAIAQDDIKRTPDIMEQPVIKTKTPSHSSEDISENRWTGYGKAAAFSNEDLDAEYEKWKAEHGQAVETGNSNKT